ncbi:hypothetical protein K458DRAFT_397716 [Lentithecium fluviatile CBS 122367]|uniref:Ubiquitin 3 binding protein But2 C-terminal domain-containing protein n=1 Tax=Lentithecium fluviatile CBS 122367 TaxID=1168545 RepID=A0A6G1IBU9_9PLEO|nr:hypothetical protein K458DRAFT_397716 [Lentithecium fluviatile CBS 122367]
MHFVNTAVYLCLLVGLSSPTPIQPPISPRACAIEYPTYIAFLEKQDPNKVGTNGTYFISWKDPSVVSGRPIPNGLDIDSFVQFSGIPSSAWGCQLEMFFPKGYWGLLGLPGGKNKLNVFRVTDPIPPHVTWNTAPKGAYLFGSTQELPTDQVLQQDTKIVINSVGCNPTMTFRVSIPEEVGRGGVEFWRDASFPGAGFRLTHNC